MPTPLQLAYVAGLFDGEGHCRIAGYRATKNGKRYYRAVATITNSDRPVLEYAARLFRLGTIHLAAAHVLPRPNVWRWQMTARAARTFLRTIRPYSRIKKAQIKKVLTYR